MVAGKPEKPCPDAHKLTPGTPADHVYVVVKRQLPCCPPPGTHLWPIGVALESIRCGNSEIDPRSKTQFDAFAKAQDSANAARTAARKKK